MSVRVRAKRIPTQRCTVFPFPCCDNPWPADVILRVPKTSVHGPHARVVRPLYMEPSERGMSPYLIHGKQNIVVSIVCVGAGWMHLFVSGTVLNLCKTHRIAWDHAWRPPLSASFRNPEPKKHEACSNPSVHGYLSAGAHPTLWISQRSQTSKGKPSAAFSCPPTRCKVPGVAQHVSRNPGKNAASRAWERGFWKAHLRLVGTPLVHGSKLPLIWTQRMTHASGGV